MLKSITPKFLKRLDTHLLENYPVVWVSKIHYAIWHGFILLILSALLGAVMPFQLESKILYGLWYFLISLIAFVFICVWTYNYVIFNKDKSYGKAEASDSILSFILVFLSLSIFALSPYPFEFIYNQRVANTFDKIELLNDIHTLNENYGYVANSNTKYQAYRVSNKDEDGEKSYFNLKKLNNSAADYFMPYLYQNQDFNNAYTRSKPGHIYNYQISEQELGKRINDYLQVSKKFGNIDKVSAEEYTKEYLSLRTIKRISPDTLLRYYESYGSNVRMVIQNICEAQYYHLFIFKADYFKTLLHVIFFFTMLLVLFKMVYWRQYLLVAVVYIFYPIVALIFSQLIYFGPDSSTNAATFWTVFFVAVCTVSLFFGPRSNYFKPGLNILNQAFFVFAAYLPLILVIILHEYTELFHNHEYRFNSYDVDIIEAGVNNNGAPKIKVDYEGRLLNDYWRAEYERWISICIYSGLIAFVVCQPIFKRLLVKQLALPRKT